jgi:hypothetical protein
MKKKALRDKNMHDSWKKRERTTHCAFLIASLYSSQNFFFLDSS